MREECLGYKCLKLPQDDTKRRKLVWSIRKEVKQSRKMNEQKSVLSPKNQNNAMLRLSQSINMHILYSIIVHLS